MARLIPAVRPVQAAENITLVMDQVLKQQAKLEATAGKLALVETDSAKRRRGVLKLQRIGVLVGSESFVHHWVLKGLDEYSLH